MPITAAGGIVQGAQDFMGLAKDMRAIQSSEAQADLVKQDTAMKTMQVNAAKQEEARNNKVISWDVLRQQHELYPGFTDFMEKSADMYGLNEVDAAGHKTITAGNKIKLGDLIQKDKQQTIGNLSALHVDILNNINQVSTALKKESNPEKQKPLQAQLDQLREHSSEVLGLIKESAVADKAGDIAVEEAKSKINEGKLSPELKIIRDSIPNWQAMTPLQLNQAILDKQKEQKTPEFGANEYKDFMETSMKGGMTKAESIAAWDKKQDKRAINKIQITSELKFAGQEKLAGQVSDDALTLAASQYLQTGQMPALGMGNATLRAKVLNKAGEMTKKSGINPMDVPSMQAEFNAQKQTLIKMTKDTSGFSAFEKGMIKNAEYAKSISAGYKRSDFPAANIMINAFRKQTGDPQVVKLTNSIYAASLEYEKIRTAGTAITSAELSIGAQKKAEELMGSAQNHKQLSAAIDVMKVDAKNIVSARNEQIAEVKKLINVWGKSTATKTESPQQTNKDPSQMSDAELRASLGIQ